MSKLVPSVASPSVCPIPRGVCQWLAVCAETGIASVPAANGGTAGTGGSTGGGGEGASSGLVAVVVILVLVVVGLVIGGVVAYRRVHRNMQTMLDDYRRMDTADTDVEHVKLATNAL